MSGDLAQALYGSPAAVASPSLPVTAPAPENVLYPEVTSPKPVQVTPPTASPVPATSPALAPTPSPSALAVSEIPSAPSPTPAITPDDIRKAIPEAIANTRKADVERTLFADAERDALAESIPMRDTEGLAPETVAAARLELANIAIDCGASQSDVAMISNALIAARANPMTNEQRAAARNGCITAFNETYGQEAYKTAEITRRWIQQDPRLNSIFSNVGDNKEVALIAARLALAAQRRPR